MHSMVLENVGGRMQANAHIPKHIPVIIDAKVGDIGNTSSLYAKMFFEGLEACPDSNSIHGRRLHTISVSRGYNLYSLPHLKQRR